MGRQFRSRVLAVFQGKANIIPKQNGIKGIFTQPNREYYFVDLELIASQGWPNRRFVKVGMKCEKT
jgi:hypothetical protein